MTPWGPLGLKAVRRSSNVEGTQEGGFPGRIELDVRVNHGCIDIARRCAQLRAPVTRGPALRPSTGAPIKASASLKAHVAPGGIPMTAALIILYRSVDGPMDWASWQEQAIGGDVRLGTAAALHCSCLNTYAGNLVPSVNLPASAAAGMRSKQHDAPCRLSTNHLPCAHHLPAVSQSAGEVTWARAGVLSP